jgi:hypothetical protein
MDSDAVESHAEMTVNELKRRFPNASAAFIAANVSAGAVAEVFAEVAQPHRQSSLERSASGTKRGRKRLGGSPRPLLRVGIVACAPRVHDLDNLIAGYKGLRDRIAVDLELDDADNQIEWHYAQIRWPTAGTIVMIELL